MQKTSIRYPKFTVLGCGNSSQALAARISLMGCSVNLGTLPGFAKRLEAIQAQGGIMVSDAHGEKFAPLEQVSSSIEELVGQAEIIFVAVPAYRHELFIRAMAPCLHDGQFVVFCSHFGAMNFNFLMREMQIRAEVTAVESLSFLYASRRTGPASVKIFATRKSLPVAALPYSRTGAFLEKVSNVFPQMNAAENVLFTSLNNSGPVLQTPLLVLNAARTEYTKGREWNIFSEGFTHAVARVVLQVEKERAAVARNLGVTNIPLTESLKHIIPTKGLTPETLSGAIMANPVLASPEMASPASLRDRFISESVPFGLVPWCSIAHRHSIPVTVMTSLISLTSAMNEVDYFREGLSAEKLGIVAEGERPGMEL